MRSGGYVLGHAERELHRLGSQARLVDPITRRFFATSGIAAGMRVLDVGSGAGHTAALLADLVGPRGEVVGIDAARAAVDTASRRAAEAGLANVSFRQGDPAEIAFDAPFDAIAGRYVLMFVPDPAPWLARVARHLRPGGVVAFHEPDWSGALCVPSVAEFDRVCARIRSALAGGGADDTLGLRLAGLFAAAGLPPPVLGIDAVIGAGPTAPDAVRLVTDLATTLRPDMQRLGILPAGAPDFEELAGTILAALGPTGTIVARAECGAWTRT